MIDPEHYFPGQEADERVFLFIRKHPLTMLGEIMAGLFLTLLPVVLLAVISVGGGEPFTEPSRNFTIIALPIYYLILAVWLFILWLLYYLDVGMVTNTRLVDIDQKSLFKRSIAELNLAWVQDVDGNRNGLLETFFDFGDVVVQTAGERTNFIFHSIPHPHEVAQKVLDLQETAMRQQPAPVAKPVHGKSGNQSNKSAQSAERVQLAPEDHSMREVTKHSTPPQADTSGRQPKQGRQQNAGVPVPPEETTPSRPSPTQAQPTAPPAAPSASETPTSSAAAGRPPEKKSSQTTSEQDIPHEPERR